MSSGGVGSKSLSRHTNTGKEQRAYYRAECSHYLYAVLGTGAYINQNNLIIYLGWFGRAFAISDKRSSFSKGLSKLAVIEIRLTHYFYILYICCLPLLT
jgi:hypothetical protein